jgi:hypothetical protein
MAEVQDCAMTRARRRNDKSETAITTAEFMPRTQHPRM